MPEPVSLRRFLAELKRRRIFRVTIVYVAVSWALIEVADTVSTPLSMPPWFPTFVILVVALGFPIAVGLAWAFDITRTEPGPVTTAPSASLPEGRSFGGPWSWSFAAIMVLAGGALALRFWPGGGASADALPIESRGIESIAVLPFVNISSDAENEHFSDGLTEELLNSLAQIPELRVAARTSSFAFKGAEVDLSEIGRRLGVETVLEGSVRKADGRLRITAQLIQVSDGYHLWSEVYQRELKEIFEIQDEISAAIVQSLAPRFAAWGPPRAHHATENVDAYDLYLRGRYRFWQGSTEAGLREAAELYERALELDPGFSLAWAGLSDAYMLLAGQIPPVEAMPKAKAAAERALQLDPRLAEGFVALASVNWLYDWDWAAADQNYRLSFSVNPLLHTRCICYAWYLASVGNEDAAVVEAERAREMDPVARLPHVILAWMYYLADRPSETRSELAEIFATSPTDVSGRRIAAWSLWDEGRREEAIAEMHRIRDGMRGAFEATGPAIVLAELASMYAVTGREAEVPRLAEALRARAARGYVPPEYVAAAEAATGDLDRAFRSMEQALENRSNLGQFSVLPVSRVLRVDPRYRDVLERIGLGSRASELVGAPPTVPAGRAVEN